MKRSIFKIFVTLCLCVLVATLTAGKDKVKIICSPLGGYSMLPETEFQISYVNSDGSVNWQKVNRMLQEIANNGANMWREFPPWITSEKEYETLTPFKFAGENMVLNQQYFDDLRKIARLSKMYNLTLIYDLFNGSETRVKPTRDHSPWKKFPGYFYTAPQKYLEIWIDAVLEANSGIDTWYQLCNEPSFEYPAFMSHVYCYLIKKGIPPERIVLGYDMRLKSIGGVYETGYRKFRQMVVEKLGEDFEIKIKRSSWTPFHATSDEALTKYWGPETPPGGQRREIFSLDARREIINGKPKRPDEQESYSLFLRILQTKSRKVELDRIGGEVIYGKEDGMDPLAQLKGLVRAYVEHTKINPENMGKFPKPLPLPTWIEETDPSVEPDPTDPQKEANCGISLNEIIDWVKKNPWIIQLITESPDNKKLKEEMEKYFTNSAAWENEKQGKLNQLTENGNTEKELSIKKQHIMAMKLEIIAWESEINSTVYMTADELKAANADYQALLTEHIKKDTLIDSLKLLLQKKNAIILELESSLQISNTLSQSNHLFYTKEFELRYIANGILKDANDNMAKANLLVIGLGGYYDPWKKTYGAGIFVGVDIRSLLKKIF